MLGQVVVAANGSLGAGLGQVVGGVFELPAAQYLLGGTQRQLAMRTRADAQIVTKAPIIEIVRALPARTGIGADFILRKACIGQMGLAGFLDRKSVV